LSHSIIKKQVQSKLIIGFIALKDLRRVAKDLGELTDDNTLQEMIERADFDQDGLVSEE
jgi:Ca2+-binding EF-hand superfamily protein